jgi:hypothetical protein
MGEAMKNYSVSFGALAPSIRNQLPKLPIEIADMFDRDSYSITRLLCRGLLTDSEGHKARLRLMKKITNAVRIAGTKEVKR